MSVVDEEREARARARWQSIAARGRQAFILRRGVLGWGLSVGLLNLVVRRLVFGEALVGSAGFEITMVLTLWPAGGYLFGAYMWSYFTGRFGDPAAEQGQPAAQ